MCDGYPGVGLCRATPHPLPPLLPLLLFLAPSPWHQSSRLTPGFHRGGTARASVSNECRVGLLARFCIRKNVTDQVIKHRQVRFYIPTSPSSPSTLWLRRGAVLYVLPICHSCLFSLGRTLCHPAKAALQETPGNHTCITTKKQKLPH